MERERRIAVKFHDPSMAGLTSYDALLQRRLDSGHLQALLFQDSLEIIVQKRLDLSPQLFTILT